MKLRRVGALIGATLLTFGMVSSVFADAANPDSINVDVNGLTVTLDGDWSWSSHGDTCDDRWVGWAVDWDDPNSAGNPVAGTGFEVGTPTDNAVHTNEDCGVIGPDDYPIGTWGPISHTYAEEGTYHVCVLTYDIHLQEGAPKNASELVAGGADNTDHNKDNSAETNGQTPEGEPGVSCIPADIVVEKVPGISIDKTVDDNIVLVGTTVTYSYLVTNTGDIDLDPVTVVDDNGTPANTADDFSPTCPATSLAVGASMTCTKSLVAGPAGTRTNIAVADGTYGEDQHVSDDDDASVLAQPPGVIATQAVGGETNVPTGPPTDAITSTTTDAGGALPLLLLVLGVIGVGALVLTPRRSRR